jgi:catechol 2,3-dioxygenase-like lactoylglutathione lyase family enzyme
MILNHINLPVADVATTRDFFARYFGMTTVFERGKNFLVMMKDEAGMVFVLSHFEKNSEVEYPKDFHIGFFLEAREEVDAIYARMIADGLEADAPPRETHGRWTFYVNAPGGIMTEVGSILEGTSWAK